MANDFVSAIAQCLVPGRVTGELRELIRVLLFDTPDLPEEKQDDLKQVQRIVRESAPSHKNIATLQQIIRACLAEEDDAIALVYGGATKIKGYVFEAPKLPEIRGASTLLDRINTADLRTLWRAEVGRLLGSEDLAEHCIVYASGGNVLAFAPAQQGADLAAAIEQTYARETITANSVAVADTFQLIELRYGLKPTTFWLEQFTESWQNDDLRPLLASYYYGEKDESPDRRFFIRKRFGELVTRLATLANRRRESLDGDHHNPLRRNIAHDQLLPGQERCATSGIRPAVVQTYQPDRPLVSEASARKLYVGQKVKRPNIRLPWFEETFGALEAPTPWELRFTHTQGSDDRLPEVRIKWDQQFRKTPYFEAMNSLESQKARIVSARDVGEIGQASKPDRYIGLIYADGNNVGRRVATLKTPEEYWEFSQKLEEATFQAVFTALSKHLRPMLVTNEEGERRWTHPFEILTIGGDDLILIVPGDAALEIACTIGAEFERQFPSSEPERMTPVQSRYKAGQGDYDFANHKPHIGLSAGVVIAPENTPIFFLRELAEELLKSAKRKAKPSTTQRCDAKKNDLVTNGSGAIDFMVMKSITMVTDNIAAFRAQALGTGPASNMRLTGRPFTWPELQGLLATARALREVNFPRSQIYGLRSRLVDARERGTFIASVMDYLYIRSSRLKSDDGDLLKVAFDSAWLGENEVISQPPWLKRAHEVRLNRADADECDQYALEYSYETIWPDIAEIYDFVHPPEIASANTLPATADA